MDVEQLNNYRGRLLSRLSGVVDDLVAVVVIIPEHAWHDALETDGDTPHKVLAHLRAIETHALSVRLRLILDEEAPTLVLFNDDKWMDTHYDPDEPPQEILEDYARLRQRELTWLRNLTGEGWNRSARHPWWGMRSLQWYVEQCLAYSEEHLLALRTSLSE
jgi:hypothetical protein